MLKPCKWCDGYNDFAAHVYCFCRCQKCGGERDGEGNCSKYCHDDPEADDPRNAVV